MRRRTARDIAIETAFSEMESALIDIATKFDLSAEDMIRFCTSKAHVYSERYLPRDEDGQDEGPTGD